MKIALINENSQAGKNKLIFDVLSSVAGRHNDKVYNFGMYDETSSHNLTYVKAGLLAGILLNAKVVDFVRNAVFTAILPLKQAYYAGKRLFLIAGLLKLDLSGNIW